MEPVGLSGCDRDSWRALRPGAVGTMMTDEELEAWATQKCQCYHCWKPEEFTRVVECERGGLIAGYRKGHADGLMDSLKDKDAIHADGVLEGLRLAATRFGCMCVWTSADVGGHDEDCPVSIFRALIAARKGGG